jgi:hypothetical protein
MIQRIVQVHREAAQGQLIKEFPDLRDKMIERRRVRQRALTIGQE